ncbi:AIPR family protein [Chitinophaga sancti]|uniref:AIPR family protein n=1 Tax=Chitinophaga sancti TaxID=1004 RepID=A0ABZ0XIZ1_9BACT|nr:AIPR family protein [Chitinophaga sancti]WQD63945.1 AIPR family protein [Chitinophaga sancti]WQG90430.1 AIPR family protein [Chitinophaga sancti]
MKVVETSNEDVFSELVRATNSQTKVDDAQFFSLRPIAKKVEQYFNTYEGQESRIYFERRDKQYVGIEIPLIRIFPIDVAAKCVTAMFCQRPDLAFRYKKIMYDEFSEIIFDDNVKESVYYAGCLTLYRLHLLVAKNHIPQNSRKYKWHMLPLVRVLVFGKNVPALNSKQIEKECDKIIEMMSSHNDQAVEVFKKALDIINSIGNITEDRLKRQAIFAEMFDKILT